MPVNHNRPTRAAYRSQPISMARPMRASVPVAAPVTPVKRPSRNFRSHFTYKVPSLLRFKGRATIAGSTTLVLLVGAISWAILGTSHSPTKLVNSVPVIGSNLIVAPSAVSSEKLQAVSVATPINAPSQKSSTLTFSPLVPSGEPQLAKLGSQGFDSAHDSYTYKDLYLALPLQVSEQPLPTNYPSQNAALAAVATSFHATNTFQTGKGTAYLVTDASTGDQTIISENSGLLVFVKSSYQHATSVWTDYLNSLVK